MAVMERSHTGANQQMELEERCRLKKLAGQKRHTATTPLFPTKGWRRTLDRGSVLRETLNNLRGSALRFLLLGCRQFLIKALLSRLYILRGHKTSLGAY